MVKQPNSQTVHAKTPSKRDLQHQIGKTRESLGDTVEEIKETAEQGYTAAQKRLSRESLIIARSFKRSRSFGALAHSQRDSLSATRSVTLTRASKRGKKSPIGQFA